MKRKDLPSGDVLCNHCTARCCRYFALPIDTPAEWKDFDNLRWFMLHGRISVFVDQKTWYLVVHNDCRHLQSDNLCGIYSDRPEICSDYSTKDCEFDNDFVYDKMFETPEQIEEYAEAVLPQKKPRRQKTQSLGLPILNVPLAEPVSHERLGHSHSIPNRGEGHGDPAATSAQELISV